MKTIIRLLLATITLAFAATAANAAITPLSADQLKAVVTKLEAAGIIPSADVNYWIENAVSGKKVDGSKLAALFKAASKKLGGPDDTLSNALNYLKDKKAVTNPASWANIETKGATGGTTGLALSVLSRVLK